MTEATFTQLIWAWIALAVILLPVQLFITAPYGRHNRGQWGPAIDNRLGWIFMEVVSPLVFALSLFWTSSPTSAAVWIIFGLWMLHYLHRTFIFPLRTRTTGKTIPLAIVTSAMGFNVINGWTNGFYLGSGWAEYSATWLSDPRFLIGLCIFFTGMAINMWADNRLINLRQENQSGYVIPRGGLFERISCPNHFGEILEWIGFAILCWNLPAVAFAVWTATNLGARALSHHRWYRQTFADYPTQRKALIPHVL